MFTLSLLVLLKKKKNVPLTFIPRVFNNKLLFFRIQFYSFVFVVNERLDPNGHCLYEIFKAIP